MTIINKILTAFMYVVFASVLLCMVVNIIDEKRCANKLVAQGYDSATVEQVCYL